jgi:hypothetical protein
LDFQKQGHCQPARRRDAGSAQPSPTARRRGRPVEGPLLGLQLLLLCGYFALCAEVDSPIGPNAANAIVAGMLGVAAMVVENVLVQISPRGAPELDSGRP